MPQSGEFIQLAGYTTIKTDGYEYYIFSCYENTRKSEIYKAIYTVIIMENIEKRNWLF